MDKLELAKMIDHTLLKPDADIEMIIKHCEEARNYKFKAVCINPYWVSVAYDYLKGTDVKVCTVIGFPLGTTTKEAKAYEADNAINNGASEIDMVINIGALKSKNYKAVEEDIKAVVNAANGRAIVKVILETGLLTDEEKVKACQLSIQAGADFVKTSTGFSNGGATLEDVKLMRTTVGSNIGVKASGGVKDYNVAIRMIEAGANRIGTSSGVAIINGLSDDTDY